MAGCWLSLKLSDERSLLGARLRERGEERERAAIVLSSFVARRGGGSFGLSVMMMRVMMTKTVPIDSNVVEDGEAGRA
jgi:hypothetical protein